ncbi:MAG: preprotein translocase subunit SecA [bacterium]|nr:preprotein translocase subunit SecA [bacterium]
MPVLTAIFGDPNARTLKQLAPIVAKINALESTFAQLDNAALAQKTVEFRARLAAGATLDDVLPEAFAAVREAAKRALGQRHFDVQLLGGIVLHRGQIAEMKTGEGKTLTSTLAVYLHALTGEGVHVVTVNDYLARRDAAWMGRVFAALGITVGCINHATAYRYDAEHKEQGTEGTTEKKEEAGDVGVFRVGYDFLRPVTRAEAYTADVTYGTNNEFGFDYLRDNMVMRASDMVQRSHAYAIVDEIDSILIDEARTPLIISAPAEESGEEYRRFAQLVRTLQPVTHYVVDEKLRAATLTEEGIAEMERLLGVVNVYAEGTKLVHHLEQALRAQVVYLRDKDYVVREGEVLIVDEFTGRLMPGRRYSEGLHQAIEAKEGVVIQRESQTLATITFQNYFRLYRTLSGMTGTAATEAEEFSKIYGLEVIAVSTNKPLLRTDRSDLVYRTEDAKLAAVVEEVRAACERGQPVLLGTISIEKNEQLHARLLAAGVPHEMLNAKQHEREGEIIAQAGRPGAVTLATNMAGRGVDIILGGNPPEGDAQERVRALSGLYVIGTERHESRRIDNQLRGRAGRQGDPGASVFFVSLDDDLMRIFGGERLKGIMTRLKVPDDVPIENRVISKQIEAAQRKVEHHHFDARKHLLEYDDVLNRHREVVYRKRLALLQTTDVLPIIEEMLAGECERLVAAATPGEDVRVWDLTELQQQAGAVIPLAAQHPLTLSGDASAGGKLDAVTKRHALVEQLLGVARAGMAELRTRVEQEERFQEIARAIALRAIDQLWIEHLDAIEHLRKGIGLRGYGQRDPLIEYKREAYTLFTELLGLMQHDTVRALMHVVPTAVQLESVYARRGIQLTGAAKTMERTTDDHGSERMATDSTDQPGPSPASRGGARGGAAVPPKRLGDAQVVSASAEQKVGRNDSCPCGSGKKFKRCHGA